MLYEAENKPIITFYPPAKPGYQGMMTPLIGRWPAIGL